MPALASPSILASREPFHCHVKQTVGAERLAQSISGWQQVYDQISPGRFHGKLTEMLLGPAQIFVESTSHALVQTCRTWPDAVWLGIPLGSGQLGRIEGTPIESGMLAVRKGGSEFQLATPDEFVFLGVVVETETLGAYVESECAEISTRWLDERVLQFPSEDLDSFRRCLDRMLRLGSSSSDELTAGAREQALEELLSGVVQLLTRRRDAPREAVSRQHARRMLRRTREYLLEHSDQCVTVHQLCAQIGTSRRALQDCFQRSLGLSPKTYLRAFGLNAARRELCSGDSACSSVGDVATKYGFWHLSQFAADYRRLFAELPSETLRQRGQPRSFALPV